MSSVGKNPSFSNILVYFSYSETCSERKKDTDLKYFTHNIFTGLIVLSILLALYMNMQNYEFRFCLLIDFQLLKFCMFDFFLNRLLYVQRNKSHICMYIFMNMLTRSSE